MYFSEFVEFKINSFIKIEIHFLLYIPLTDVNILMNHKGCTNYHSKIFLIMIHENYLLKYSQ
jgi:hypothetical protein